MHIYYILKRIIFFLFLRKTRTRECERSCHIPLKMMENLIYFLNLWAFIFFCWWSTWCCASWETTWHTAWHTTWHTARSCATSIHFLHNWVADSFQFFLLCFVFFLFVVLVCIQPLDCFFNFRQDGGLIFLRYFTLQFLIVQGVLHGVAVVFKTVLGLNTGSICFIFRFVLFCFGNHAFNFLTG